MVVGSHLSVCTVFEILVVLFQVCGILGLCLNRLMPRTTRWPSRGQTGLIVALFGLGDRRCASAGGMIRSSHSSPVGP